MNNQEKVPAKNKIIFWPSVIISILIAVIIGGAVYTWAWQVIGVKDRQIKDLQQELISQSAPPVKEITPEVQIEKPTVTSIEKNSEGNFVIKGKAKPNSSVWLYQVPEMDEDCLVLGTDALNLADLADENGNFEKIYTPSEDILKHLEFYEFAIVSIDSEKKYDLSWIENKFCAPNETKSEYFKLSL